MGELFSLLERTVEHKDNGIIYVYNVDEVRVITFFLKKKPEE